MSISNPSSSSSSTIGTDLASSASGKGASLVTYKRTESGSTARTVQAKLLDRVSVEDFSATGNGIANDSTPFNNAIAALVPLGGGVIELNSPSYVLASPLSPAGKNITFVGMRGQPLLIKTTTAGNAGFLDSNLGVYDGYRFENIAFDGQRAAMLSASLGPHSVYLLDAQNISFDRCRFLEFHNIYLDGCRNVRVENCEFLGTRAGVMAAGQQDPAAVATAQYGESVILGRANSDILFRHCRFHFPQSGINGAATQTSRSRGVVIDKCIFISDWWNAPYITQRFTPTSIDWNTRILTCSTTDFTVGNHFNDFQVMSVPIQITTGSAFTTVTGGNVIASGTPFATARTGDVIETSNGKRAVITSVQSSTTVWIKGWEAVDTFEPTTSPVTSTAWRLRRYYSSIALRLSATTLQIYGTDFVNEPSGEQLHTDAGLTPVGISCREHAKMYYSGIHMNGGQDGLVVTDCEFEGSWADQCSMFDCDAPIVTGNNFRCGQDEGITCTRCERATLSNNHFLSCGSSAIFLGDAHHATVSGNTIHMWAVTNTNVRGAIENAGLGMAIFGNTFTSDDSVNTNGSKYAINLDTHSSLGTVIGNNIDGGAKVGTLYVDTNAVPSPNAITARDCLTIDGPGAANVNTGGGSGGGMAIGGAVTGGTSGSVPYIDSAGNLAQQNGSLQWDPTNHRLSINGSTLGAKLGLRGTATENTVLIYNAVGDIVGVITEVGSFSLIGRSADAGNTSNPSPTQTFRSTRWTGSAQANESFDVGITRYDSGANRNALQVLDNDGSPAFAIAGKGGVVASGYSTPVAGDVTTLGQLHARAVADANPALTAQRKSATQSAVIFGILDENSALLSWFNKGGYFVTAIHSAPSDGDIVAGQCFFWFDQTAGASKLKIKAKNVSGTIVTGEVSLV